MDLKELNRRGYRLESGEILQDKDYRLIKKSGIKKIKDKENIHITDIEFVKISELMNGLSVIVKGYAERKNSKGFVVDSAVMTASANPENCGFPYKVEVAQKRVESRLVLYLAGLSEEFIGEDEENTSSKAPVNESDVKGESALNEALESLKVQ